MRAGTDATTSRGFAPARRSTCEAARAGAPAPGDHLHLDARRLRLELQRRGVRLYREGDDLRTEPAPRRLPARLLRVIAENREGLRALLRQESP